MEDLGEVPGYVTYYTNTGQERRRILTGDERKSTFTEIPVIDASSVNSTDLGARLALAKEVDNAATNVGFMYMVNPPIDTKLMDDAFDAIKKFFDMSAEKKLKIHLNNSIAAKGYSSDSEINESFRMGNDHTEPEQHYVKVAEPGVPHLNQWPDEDLPEFRKIIYAYYRAVRNFSDKLLGIFALALGLDEHGLDHLFKFPMTEFTIQHYLKHDHDDAKPTLGAHTDYGAFTCLLQHEVGGLEVLNANAEWVKAPIREHAFIINTGTYFEVLSNGRWVSTVHRVWSKGDKERFTVPFFYSFDPSVSIRPLQLTPGEEPKYGEKNIGIEHIKGMVASLPNHPFSKKLLAEKFEEKGYTFESILKGEILVN